MYASILALSCYKYSHTVLQSQAAKQMMLSWMDFSSTGFTHTDVPLSATLQFSTPLVNLNLASPEQQADITHKLKKTQKSLPPIWMGHRACDGHTGDY